MKRVSRVKRPCWLNLKISFLLLVLFVSCDSNREDYLKGNWTIISLSGVEEKRINGGDYFRTGLRVTIRTSKNNLRVKLNSEDYTYADFSINWEDSLFNIMNSNEEWLNGNYSFTLQTKGKGIIEDRMELQEGKKNMMLVGVTNKVW